MLVRGVLWGWVCWRTSCVPRTAPRRPSRLCVPYKPSLPAVPCENSSALVEGVKGRGAMDMPPEVMPWEDRVACDDRSSEKRGSEDASVDSEGPVVVVVDTSEKCMCVCQ